MQLNFKVIVKDYEYLTFTYIQTYVMWINLGDGDIPQSSKFLSIQFFKANTQYFK